MSSGAPIPTGGEFKPITDTPSATPTHDLQNVVTETENISAVALRNSAVPSTPSPLTGRVKSPEASMDKSGVLTVTYEGHAYRYDPSGELFASGAVNKVFSDLTTEPKPQSYVLTLPKSKTPQSLESQKATLEYQKELHKDGLLENVEPPGHIVTYTDPKTGEEKTALWSKQYNRRDLDYFMKQYPVEFAGLSPDKAVDLGMQVIKGMTNLILKRSTYLDAKPENIGVEVLPNGEVRLYIRDFDDVARIPTADELEDDKTRIAFIKHLEKFPGRNFTPELMPIEEYRALAELSQKLKTSLQIEDISEDLLEQFAQGVEKLQAFQTGSILYAMIHPKGKVPLELTKDHTLIDVETVLLTNLAKLGIEPGKLSDVILELIDLDPQDRYTLTA